jgi:hypothetical protein
MILSVTRRIAVFLRFRWRWHMAFSNVCRQIRRVSVPVLLLGLAVVAATPAVAAGRPGPPRPPGLAWSPGPASRAFPAGLWRPADGPGTWGPLKAPASAPAAAAAPGSPWRLQRTPNPVVPNGTLVAGSCTGRGACVAVGGDENRSGTQVALAQARTGTGWRIQATPVPAGAIFSNLFGVSCTAAGACTAAGYYVDAAQRIHPLAERWNGTNWSIQPTPSPAGQPEAGFFAVSCSSAAACTAVGAQTGSTGSTTPLAERWNGAKWSIQPVSGLAGSLSSELLAVSCPAAAACTAAGSEIDSSQTSVPLAERWNGTTWRVQAVPGPTGAVGSGFSGLSCSSPAACTAVGSYGNASGNSELLAEAWNGRAWSIQATPAPAGSTQSEFLAVSCTVAAACTAVGATETGGAGRAGSGSGMTVSLAERWNGSTWRIQATPVVGRSVGTGFAAVSCSAATACTAAGSYETASRLTRPTAAAWGGKSWHRQATPSRAGASLGSVLDGLSCPSPRACTAVGSGNTASLGTTLAERWGGTRWRIQPTPLPAGAVEAAFGAVSCSSPRSCTAVGNAFIPGQREVALAERWSGGHWAVQRLPKAPKGAQGSQLSAVSCPAADRCVAVGTYFTRSGGTAFAAVWDGTRWQVQPLPGPAGSGLVVGVSCPSPASCVAVGQGTEIWNGTTWRYVAMAEPAGAQGPALNGVSCTSAGSCTAVGQYFSTAGGPLTLAETWNGTAWQVRASPNPIAHGRNQLNTVSCTSPSACTAVGVDAASDFAPSGAFAAAWDGSRWRLESVPVPAGAVATELFGVSCPGARCVAAGTTTGPSGIGVTLAMTTGGT